jgi:hypothetical protein
MGQYSIGARMKMIRHKQIEQHILKACAIGELPFF